MIEAVVVLVVLLGLSWAGWVILSKVQPKGAQASWGALEAYQFLMVGRGLSLDEFLRLDDDSREAFTRIAEEIRASHAADLATMITNPETAVAVSDKISGGTMREQALLAAAMQAATATLAKDNAAAAAVLPPMKQRPPSTMSGVKR